VTTGQTDARASFVLSLEDDASGAAQSAAGGLERLRDSIDGDLRALRDMQKGLKNLQLATQPNIRQVAELKKQIAAKKETVGLAQSKFLALGGELTRAGQKTNSFKDKFAELAKSAQKLPGPLGQILGKLGSLGEIVTARAIGLVALGAAITYVAVKTVTAAAELYKYGVAQADARRSELLRLEGLTKLRFWYRAAAGNAQELQGAIDQVSASSAISRQKTAQYAEQLYRMGLRGANLSSALEGVAIKASVQGDAAASAFAGWAAGAAMTGHSVKKLSDDVKARLGGVAAAQMQSLTVQTEKQKEAFDALFSGLNVNKLEKASAETNALLSQTTNSGKALKAVMTSLLQPLIDARAKLEPLMKKFFQGMIIAALRVGIAFQLVRLWFKRTFGSQDLLHGIDMTRVALYAGEVAAFALAAAFAPLVIATAAGVAALASIFSVVTQAASGFMLLWQAWQEVDFALLGKQLYADLRGNLIDPIFELWHELDFKMLGQYLWQGIVEGIAEGIPKVLESVSNLGKLAWDTFKDKLGIHSPSRVFLQLGAQIPAGAAAGVHMGAPKARRAVADMIRPEPLAPARFRVANAAAPSPTLSAGPTYPRVTPQSEPQNAGDNRKGGTPTVQSVTIGDIHIHSSSDKPVDLARDFRLELERIVEGVAIQLGVST
jgi:hypothetical protein